VRRTLEVNAANFTLVDLRTAAWFGQAARLNAIARAAAVARGIVRRIDMKIQNPTAGTDWVQYSDRESPGGEYYNQADSGTPVLRSDYPTNLQVSTFWWRTSGAVTLELEIWFDIPPASSIFATVLPV